MFDFNYFKNDFVLLFISNSTIFFIGVIVYRRYHGIKFRSITSALMTIFYFLILVVGVYLSYYEVLANYYYKNGLYKEASYRFIKSDEIKSSRIYKIFDKLIVYDNPNRKRNKMLSFYASKNYNRAIPYLLDSYKKEKNIKNSIFIKLYLAHSYLETGNPKGKELLLSSYIEAICYLNKNDLKFFEKIIKLNYSLKKIINFI